MDLKAYDPNISAQFLPPGTRYGFMAESGVLIWRNVDPEGVIGTKSPAEAAQRMLEVRNGEFESVGSDGVSRFYSVAHMPETGWIAFVGVPVSAVYATARQRAATETLIAFIAICLLIYFAIFFLRRVTGPIATLERAAKAVHAGNLGTRVPISGPTEIAEVARAFNAMIEGMEASTNQLKVEISAHARTEESLRLSEQQMAASQQIGGTGSWVYGIATNGINASAQSLAMFGFAPGGREYSLGDFLACIQDRDRVSDVFAVAIREEKAYDDQFVIVPADGSPARVIHSMGRLEKDAQGNPLRVVGFIQDITDRKRAEDEIRSLNETLEVRISERTASLEQALRDLESFSYSTSHDLRTPLRAINGFSQVLIQTEREKLSDEGKRLLDRIAQAAIRLGRLIDDVLEYSRIGRIQMKHDRVDLNTLCREVANELQSLYPQTRITQGPLPSVTGDATMLKQVLQNLISNACKFTVAAADSKVDVGMVESANEQVFYVKDNGVGFDMNYADKLFCMFERLHTEDQFSGSGVGLAIVKRLIERHGGRIWAESAPGKGASFFFSLKNPPEMVLTRQGAPDSPLG
jgi:PAS domain S-box-containing protein